MRKSMILFYFLFFYALAQLVWWGILLIRLEPDRWEMIIGEGVFFAIIFLVGAYRLKKTFVRERAMQQQQRNFLLAVTHELKSPLASIKLYIQTILKRELDKEQQQKFLSNSLKDIERLDDLVENVLIATKLESIRPTFPKEEINLTSLIQSVATRLQGNGGHSHHLRLDLEEEVFLQADKFALTNVVTNLIENAIKYSPGGGEIAISLEQEEGQIRFCVADQGVGISNEEKKNVFQKFYRVGNEETRKAKGTGLGLYIVKIVLEKHHAQIKIKDNHPTGSIFEVIFKTYATS